MNEEHTHTDLTTAAAQAHDFRARFQEEVGHRLVLPRRLVEQAAIALAAGGHLMLQGRPGLGKRTLASTLAALVDLPLSIIACTSETEPVDLIGTERHPGPLLAAAVYVEDVDRLPPKSLAVVIDWMRRRQTGLQHAAGPLPEPFVLIASVADNLDDLQPRLGPSDLDRFLLTSVVRYPSDRQEWEIGRRAGHCPAPPSEPLISAGELKKMQTASTQVVVPDDVLGYAWALVRATRPGNDLAPDFVETWIRLGVSPQGLVALLSAAKARALLEGRGEATRQDVYFVARPVLRHRIWRNEEAEAASLSIGRLIGMSLDRVPIDSDYPKPEN